jgi:hypothetical protein
MALTGLLGTDAQPQTIRLGAQPFLDGDGAT